MLLERFTNTRIVLLLLAWIFFISGFFLSFSGDLNHGKLVKAFEKNLHRKEQILKKEVDTLQWQAESAPFEVLFEKYSGEKSALLDKEGIVLLVYENDTLKFWTNNSAAVENHIREVCLDDRLAQLKNGWFEVYKKQSQPAKIRMVFGLILLKREYPYQNRYLKNNFGLGFEVPEGTRIIKGDENNVNKIYSSLENESPNYLCTLIFPPVAKSTDSPFEWLLVILYFLGFLSMIAWLKMEYMELAPRLGKLLSISAFLAVIFLLRWVTIFARFPEPIYNLPLFGPDFYGDATSFWLPSLGDLCINALLFLYLAYFLNRELPGALPNWIRKKPLLFVSLILVFIAFLLGGRFINHLFIGLIENSNIQFDINNLFQLNLYSYIALAIPGIILFGFYFLAEKFIEYLTLETGLFRKALFPFLIALALFLVYSHAIGALDEIMSLWPAVLLLTVAYTRTRLGKAPTFTAIALVLLVFSFYSAHMFLKFSRLKEYANRKLYIEKLAVEQDPIAEHLFNEVAQKIKADTTLFYNVINRESFGKNIIERYFGGYWDKFDIKVSVFDTLCFPIIDGPVPNRDNHAYYDEQISSNSFPTENPHLYYIDNPEGKVHYLARVPIYLGSRNKVRVADMFVEMGARFITEEIGFPELLLEKEIGLTQKLSDYSYARFYRGQMISSFGRYDYSFYMQKEEIGIGEQVFEASGGYHHLLYRPNPDTLILLSRPLQGRLGFVTTFSYLFTYFSLILLLVLLLRQLFIGFNFSQLGFKYRIQLLMIFTVLTSLLLFGAGTIFYITQQYENQNMERIREKSQSVVVEVEGKITGESRLTQNYSEYATYILKKFSNVFFTDITLFDLGGNMYATSRPKVFEEGLASRKMNPDAFYSLAYLHKNIFIHEENIGDLRYLSAYVPFRNKNGNLIAFLNLPYFAKQTELEKEISTFLAALINIYVLLFALSVGTAIVMSNYLTKPLRMIQAKLGNIKLGKKNEEIRWKQKDEIGSLVAEYNRMIGELQASAELLARSERESAWREMAKQVAHEIKNPLTPMKLSIQHLERLIKDDSPDIKEKIGRLSKTLIDQIETLSNIASEFSNFAKMPRPNLERHDLKQILENSLELFRDSPGLELSMKTRLDAAEIIGDKDQLLRVFNNLIKNGIQAIPEGRHGKIIVELEKQNENYLISIIDNGSGIPEELREKIFNPNFTTKTTGMGLGLAMVKNIVTSHEGEITFDTKEGEGTCFVVKLKIPEA